MWRVLAWVVCILCAAQSVARAGEVHISLLAGPGMAPLSDPDWPQNGLVAELVGAAFEAGPEPVTSALSWEADWSRHLFPMLDSQTRDMGFPWFRPDCAADPAEPLCTAFHFSDPLLDLVVLLFVRADAPLTFEADADLDGAVLCRPAGLATHMLAAWLDAGRVALSQPATPRACFEQLMAGQVDAVVLNEFLGVQQLFDMGLTDKVLPLTRPVSVEGVHLVISKKHWQGTTHLYRFNAGLAALRQSDRYDEIVARHLAHFWERIKG